jgi:hypothetical protein
MRINASASSNFRGRPPRFPDFVRTRTNPPLWVLCIAVQNIVWFGERRSSSQLGRGAPSGIERHDDDMAVPSFILSGAPVISISYMKKLLQTANTKCFRTELSLEFHGTVRATLPLKRSFRGERGRRGAPHAFQTPLARLQAKTREKRRPPSGRRRFCGPTDFSHGLLDF